MQQDLDWNRLPPAEKARTLVEMGNQARKEGQDQVACNYYAQSLHLCRGLDDPPNIVRNLIRLAYLTGWADFGDGLNMIERRQRLGDEALPLAREIGDKALLADALCAFAAGAPGEQATAMLNEAIVLAEESGNKATLAYALTRSANGVALQGNHEHARALNEQSLELYREIGDKAGMAGVLFGLAIRAEWVQQRSYLEQALALQRELGAKKRMAEILMWLQGSCDPQELDLREAYNLEARELCREMGNPIWEAACLNRLAEIARARGDHAGAEALEAESRSVYQEPEADPVVEQALNEPIGSGDIQTVIEGLNQRYKS